MISRAAAQLWLMMVRRRTAIWERMRQTGAWRSVAGVRSYDWVFTCAAGMGNIQS